MQNVHAKFHAKFNTQIQIKSNNMQFVYNTFYIFKSTGKRETSANYISSKCGLLCSFVVYFCSSSWCIAGSWGPGAQRLSPAVCLWEAEGSADADGRSGLPGSDGDSGHGDRAAAARIHSGNVKKKKKRPQRICQTFKTKRASIFKNKIHTFFCFLKHSFNVWERKSRAIRRNGVS